MCVRADDDSDVCNDIIRFCDRTSDKECACVRARSIRRESSGAVLKHNIIYLIFDSF